MASERYRLSFTTGGLYVQEAQLVAALYLSSKDWSSVRKQLQSQNLLQARTLSSAKRNSLEVVCRLQELNDDELEGITAASVPEKAFIMWSAACRRYAIIKDFAIEVLREHYLLRRGRLTEEDFNAFYHAKVLWHEELEQISAATQQRLRQNLFRMMREAGLLSAQNHLQSAWLAPWLAQLFARRGEEALRIFPINDYDVQRWLA